MTVKKLKQPTLFDIYFDEDRELMDNEKANISKKVKDGYVNVHWFRHNLFNATATGSCIKYEKPKMIFKNSEMEIFVSHALNQKHADVLSLLYVDNLRSEKMKLKDDGSFFLYTKLYHIAKKMGYKNPKGSVHRVKKLLNDLRDVDFIIKKAIPNHDNQYHEVRTKILGDSEYISVDEIYRVAVGARSARVLAMSVAVKIDKTLNEKIIAIPDNGSKIKALIRYLLANKILKNGLTIEWVFDWLKIGNKAISDAKENTKGKSLSTIRKDRSVFKRQLIEYKDILSEFNITFDEEKQKIYRKKHSLVEFDMDINPISIVNQIEDNRIDKYIGKWIQPANGVLAKIFHVNEHKNNNFYIEATLSKTEEKIKINSISREDLENILDDDLNEYYNV